jgi:plasmid stabilization system protein ParE
LNIFFSITPIAAYDLEDHIFESAKNLSNYPYMGVSGRALGTRELLVHPNYWIVYEVTDVISIFECHTHSKTISLVLTKQE